MRIRTVAVLLMLPCGVAAQQPLSVIDWLNQPAPDALPGIVLLEPPVTETGLLPTIEVSPLETLLPPLGLVPTSVTGLPPDLWRGSDPGLLAELIARAPVRDSPAMQKLLFTLLLSESRPPSVATEAEILLLARLDRLLQLGATEPAQALAQLAGPAANAARFSRWFDATLLTGDEDRSCSALIASPHLAPGYPARIFCQARRGDWPSAALTLEAAHALDLLPPGQLDLLDRFLSPDVFEGAPPLPEPSRPDPLTFRMHEAIGERLPTASLPRAFATADLRDVAGWKAQIEAAERLAQIGALTPNHLLGLYTARVPAASGGVWDRVRAIQRFDTAIQTGSRDAISKTLPDAWAAMESARLEVPFADLFATSLAWFEPDDPAVSDLVFRVRLLSENYEEAARDLPKGSGHYRFLAALARGEPGDAPAHGPRAQAIADGFADDAVIPPAMSELLRGGRLGEAILQAIALFDSGTSGNLADLTGAIATFRHLGLEDTARRAALQQMLLARA